MQALHTYERKAEIEWAKMKERRKVKNTNLKGILTFSSYCREVGF